LLSKGLIGIVFPGAVIFLYLLFTRRWQILKEMRLMTGILLFLLVCAPWFILVSMRNPEFAHYFFIREHFERFTTTVHHRKQGLWFYVPVLLGTMLPWSFFIPAAVAGVWRERQAPEGNARLYLFIWATFIFLFFSISNSQLITYILPVFPPLALLMGLSFARSADLISRSLKSQGYAIAGLLTIGGIGIICYPHLASRPDLTAIGGAIIGGIFLCEGIVTFNNTFRGSTLLIFTGLLLFSYIVGIAGPPFVLSGIAKRKSLKEVGLIIKEKAGKDAVVVSFGLQQGLSYYAERRVVIVGDLKEVEFGSRQGDQSAWFPDLQGFKRLWDSSTPVFTLLSEAELKRLQGEVQTTPRIVDRHGKKILITNRGYSSMKEGKGLPENLNTGSRH
jgi:hypothetical protein